MSGLPPDFAELASRPAHVRAVVREAVSMAAQDANRERDEALADRTATAVVRGIAQLFGVK